MARAMSSSEDSRRAASSSYRALRPSISSRSEADTPSAYCPDRYWRVCQYRRLSSTSWTMPSEHATLMRFRFSSVAYTNGVSPALAAGIFVIFLQIGAVVSIVVFGWLNVLGLKQKFVVSKVFALAALGLLIVAHTPAAFLIASVALGLSRGVYNAANMPIIKRLSRSADATDYYAISSVFQLPFSFGLPLAAGAFLDAASPLGSDSYRILFAGLIVVVVVAGFLILRLRMGQRTETTSP